MPVILLAHRDPQLRATLGAALTARGFEVIGVDSVDTALDAAAAGATALLVEMQLLVDEDLEVKTRLDLRSGRPTRILALTHKASPQEMSMLKRHGAGLLSRSVEDVERMAAMLRIEEEAPAPWEGSKSSAPPPSVARPASPSKPMVAAPKAQPSSIVPPPAPRPPPPAMMPAPAAALPVAAPWDDSKAIDLGTSPPPPTFKPAPAQFMPPDLSKSFSAAAPAAEAPRAEPPPKPLPPPPSSDDAATAIGTPALPPSPPSFDDAATAIGTPALPASAARASDDGPLQVPADLFEPPPPSPPATPTRAAFAWNDDTEGDLPRVPTDVFRDETQVPTNNILAGAARPDALSPAVAEALREEAAASPPPPKGPPKVEVEAEAGSTGKFAMSGRTPAPVAPPPVLEERTQVIPELADTAIPVRTSADPAESAVPDIANISATVSGAWFDDSAVNGVEKPSGSGPVVLVVEDEPAFRTFLKEALGGQGYRVHTAINGPNALRFVKATPRIDLVISDLHMPHMDGFELKHEIDQCLGRSMPFIVCTADANDEKIQVAAQVGAAALVPKPIENLEAFFAIVTDTLIDAGVIARPSP